MHRPGCDNLPVQRRVVERFYRSIVGVGAYYLIEIWFRHMMFPRSSDCEKLPQFVSALDRVAVAVFASAQIAVAAAVGWPERTVVLLNVAAVVVVPQLIWNWLIGLVVLLHHTHPRVRWYNQPDKWSFYAGQVQSTVHVHFPWPIGPVLHHIMEHTAHHVDPRIPLYNLPAAQRRIESAFCADVIVSRFTLFNLRGILKQCQLFDYDKCCWLTFNGVPTTEPAMFPTLMDCRGEMRGRV
jgi:omega-6 fatty acid desaturase (delta-12 desaturase)